MIVAPPQPRAGSFGGGGTQQPASSFMSTPAASFRPSQAVGVGAYPAAAGRPAAGPAGAPTGPGAASGPAVFVSGGLAGFTGRTATGLGNPSAVLSPALLPPAPQGFALTGVQPGFAVGSMAEGLAGLGGVEGAGMRVFAALSPAYVDTAQALLRLWKHMAGLPAWAPPEALLQAVVETVATGVCAGEVLTQDSEEPVASAAGLSAIMSLSQAVQLCRAVAAAHVVPQVHKNLHKTSSACDWLPALLARMVTACRRLVAPTAAIWPDEGQPHAAVSTKGAPQHQPPHPQAAAAGGGSSSSSRPAPGCAVRPA